jgi:undecaprenyl phosphate-alpha-L-ara4N flippase subunit ArnE
MGVRHGELTVLYPMVSLGYVWALLWARLYFNEPMTKSKFAGLGMILAGIVLLYAGGN